MKAPAGVARKPKARAAAAAGAKASTDRVRALRDRRRALGLTRLDIYAHPSDHPAIVAMATALTERRIK
jgi:hypothetical protein